MAPGKTLNFLCFIGILLICILLPVLATETGTEGKSTGANNSTKTNTSETESGGAVALGQAAEISQYVSDDNTGFDDVEGVDKADNGTEEHKQDLIYHISTDPRSYWGILMGAGPNQAPNLASPPIDYQATGVGQPSVIVGSPTDTDPLAVDVENVPESRMVPTEARRKDSLYSTNCNNI